MKTAIDYLRLITAYCDTLGGLRWSPSEDALEYASGKTFAFTEELAQVIEGFAGKRLVHFCYLMHLLDLLRNPERTLSPELFRMRRAFAAAGRSLRNAGAFFAVLCRDVPEAAEPVDAREVTDCLRNPNSPVRSFIVSFHDTLSLGEHPPLNPEVFERIILDQLKAFTEEEFYSWFRNGRGPVRDAGEKAARELSIPRTLTGTLAELLDRPRLAGARAFVAQLTSALTLPRRRLDREDLPVGGYDDVTTHGKPDQLLPSQLALDELDFLRRFADRELLYFRREEPHAQRRQELVVLLDQGVRTWGDVRLVLSAAVLALGKQATGRKCAFLLATTSDEGRLVDPLQVDAETLGRLVEASDLTANPGLALERVLERPAEVPRDVVLLTHTRNLREADVADAARRLARGSRLFALGMEAAGQAELVEMKHGVPVSLRQFRIHFPRSPEPTPRVQPDSPVGGSRPWQGDIEPVGFPFRFGSGAPAEREGLFDFDHAGGWLLSVGQGGILHAWKTDGRGGEVLPRAFVNGEVLTNPEAVVGVAGGFVVAGQLSERLVAVHYDFARRFCRVHVLGQAFQGKNQWGYSPSYHTLLILGPGKDQGYALDLATGTGFSPGEVGPHSRAREAWFIGSMKGYWTRQLPGAWPLLCFLNPAEGRLLVHGAEPPWQPFIPLADGRPVLKECHLLEAQRRGLTLGIKARHNRTKNPAMFHLFRGPDGVPIAEYPMGHPFLEFTLSPDGKLLARRMKNGKIHVNTVGNKLGWGFVTRAGGFPKKVDLFLGEGWLILRLAGRSLHLVRWDREGLELFCRREASYIPLDVRAFPFDQVNALPQRKTGVEGSKARLPQAARNDPERFQLGAETEVGAAVDQFGQVAIFNRRQELVCMFFAFRNHFAAWLPDGTRLGPAHLTGGPPTPGAAEKIGRALREASALGRNTG